MLSRTLGVVATVAMGANALLLPFGANFEGDSLSIAASNPKSQLVRMPCRSCVFSSKAQNAASITSDEETFHAQGGAIDLIFNVSISADNQLLVNGDVVDDWNPPQNVIQVPASASAQEIVDQEARMEILRVTGIAASSYSDGVITRYEFTISSLDRHPVDIDNLIVKTLTLDDGELAIVETDHKFTEEQLLADIAFNQAKKAQHDATHPKPPPADCSAAGPFHRMFCEVKSQIAKFRTAHFSPSNKKPGCKGGKNGLFRGHAAGGKPPGMVIGVLPGHIKHHRPHHHHHAGPPVAGYIASAAFILGVWIASFFVGMVLAKVILFVTACVRRVFFGVPVRREVVVVKEEGQALMAADEEEEALPVYEDAPEYEEKQ